MELPRIQRPKVEANWGLDVKTACAMGSLALVVRCAASIAVPFEDPAVCAVWVASYFGSMLQGIGVTFTIGLTASLVSFQLASNLYGPMVAPRWIARNLWVKLCIGSYAVLIFISTVVLGARLRSPWCELLGSLTFVVALLALASTARMLYDAVMGINPVRLLQDLFSGMLRSASRNDPAYLQNRTDASDALNYLAQHSWPSWYSAWSSLAAGMRRAVFQPGKQDRLRAGFAVADVLRTMDIAQNEAIRVVTKNLCSAAIRLVRDFADPVAAWAVSEEACLRFGGSCVRQCSWAVQAAYTNLLSACAGADDPGLEPQEEREHQDPERLRADLAHLALFLLNGTTAQREALMPFLYHVTNRVDCSGLVKGGRDLTIDDVPLILEHACGLPKESLAHIQRKMKIARAEYQEAAWSR